MYKLLIYFFDELFFDSFLQNNIIIQQKNLLKYAN